MLQISVFVLKLLPKSHLTSCWDANLNCKSWSNNLLKNSLITCLKTMICLNSLRKHLQHFLSITKSRYVVVVYPVSFVANTTCPRSSYAFYMVSYYIKWVTTSWTHCLTCTSLKWYAFRSFALSNLCFTVKF